MDTLQPQSQAHDRTPEAPDPVMPDLGPLRDEATGFAQEAANAIRNALSHDSLAFLSAVRQHGAQ